MNTETLMAFIKEGADIGLIAKEIKQNYELLLNVNPRLVCRMTPPMDVIRLILVTTNIPEMRRIISAIEGVESVTISRAVVETAAS